MNDRVANSGEASYTLLMDWRALAVFALIFGIAIGFAGGWHMGSTHSEDAGYRRGFDAGRNKADEAKYAAQLAASNAKVAEINRQIEIEKQKNDQRAREETAAPRAAGAYSRPVTRTQTQAPPVSVAAASSGPTWGELEVKRAREVREEQEMRRRAEERARAEQEIRENTFYYLSGGMYHRYGCAFLSDPLVRARLKDARLASVPCGHCNPPR